MRTRVLGAPAVLVLVAAAASAQVYNPTPEWQSADMQVSTGAALADLNNDGWLDLIVANGNDISLQRTVVYYNNGAGVLQTSPGWQSADLAYNGHLDVADVDGDGWLDVAVAVLLPQGGKSAKLYRNVGGTLTTSPVWQSSITPDTFGVAFGDMNLDGRPDLALASGDAYSNVPAINVVYLNVGGTLAASPSWSTATTRNFNNCAWVDADDDGDLDLIQCGSAMRTYCYRNLGTTLETTATAWSTSDSTNQFCLMAVAGDVTGDGRKDVIIADNNQIFGGTGRFRRYDGQAGGFFSSAANWTYNEGYTAAVTLGDLNNDGKLDLLTGEWFGRARYFLNTGSGLPATPSWTSGGVTTTVEKLVLGDTRNRARKVYTASFGATARRLYQLPRQPIETIVSVVRDGVPLTRAQFTYNREHAWVSVHAAPASSLKISYIYSRSLDLAVSNWDDNRPNQVYHNRLAPPCPADFNDDGAVDDFDVFDFLNVFNEGDPAADFNLDGSVDDFDYFDFLNRFFSNC
ncbi:MAG: VCBS repeat-containing protein [Phycisphaerae bacterium]|nr:VCBS repeat-containing protein [Phycisphaerae bacterium]